jgi:predicted metal-dependent peptidase
VLPKRFVVLHVNTRVHDVVDEYTPDEYPISLQSRVTGGTDMTAGVKYAADNYPEAECIVVFTDGYTPFGELSDARGIPVLWCITSGLESPHGETIHVDLDA